MKGDKRRIKKIVTGLVILVLLGITLSGVRIRSVGQYKQEQKQLANDLFATPDKTQTDNGTVSETEPPDEVGASEAPGRTSTSEPEKQTTKPKTVKESPQRTPGTDNTASPQPSCETKAVCKEDDKAAEGTEGDREAVDQNEAVIVGTESNEEAIRYAESDSKTCSTYLYDNDPL